jgi:hypothetical protein
LLILEFYAPLTLGARLEDMRIAQAPSAVGVRRGWGLRTVGLAVLLLALTLLALAAVLSTISPLRLDPVLFGGSILIGIVLSLGLILIGKSRSLPYFIPPPERPRY